MFVRLLSSIVLLSKSSLLRNLFYVFSSRIMGNSSPGLRFYERNSAPTLVLEYTC